MSRANKFGAVKIVVDSITFDSKAEANRFLALKALQDAGRITDLELQPVYPLVIDGRPLRGLSERGLGRPLKAVFDFRYKRDGVVRIEDVKGKDLPLSRLKRAIVQHLYGIKVEVVK